MSARNKSAPFPIRYGRQDATCFATNLPSFSLCATLAASRANWQEAVSSVAVLLATIKRLPKSFPALAGAAFHSFLLI
jgi:hypothetical protein